MSSAGRVLMIWIALAGWACAAALAIVLVSWLSFLGVALLGVTTWFVGTRIDLEKAGAVGHELTPELYARQIFQSDLYGFIEVEEYIFNERSQIVVDPAEERLKSEFAGVKRSYIPMHTIIRIDEVEKEGKVRIRDVKGGDSKIATLPLPGLRPQVGTGGAEPKGES